MAAYKGIDISAWQPNNKIDWPQVKAAGIEFVIIKLTEGTAYKSAEAAAQCADARSAGIHTHEYHWLKSNTEAGARKEADHFASMAKSLRMDGYLFIDVEDSACRSGLVPAQLSANLNAFFDQLVKNGYTKFGVYANLNWFRNYISRAALRKDALIWLAQYASAHSDPCDIWQHSSGGRISGYAGNLDMDISYTDVMIGAAVPNDPAPLATAQPGAVLLKMGSKGDAVKQLQMKLNTLGHGLAVDGIFGHATEAAVRAFQKTCGLVVDGIVGPMTAAALT